jgi:tRNA(fMet)-specific endonuclease VapC
LGDREKILLDTNVYVDWLRSGRHEDRVVGRGPVRFLSAVVEMELRAGATTRAARRGLDQAVRGYAATARIIPPSTRTFAEAGDVLRTLRAAGREVRRASLVHDVLIALTARAIGAKLVTVNVGDFQAIRALRPFSLEVVPVAP